MQWLETDNDAAIARLQDSDAGLASYDRDLFEALFPAGESVTLSGLMGSAPFALAATRMKEQVAAAVTEQARLFSQDPNATFNRYRKAGMGLAGMGLFVVGLWAGNTLSHQGRGVLALPLMVGAALLFCFGGAMSTRTAAGRELYRRVLGFRQYVAVGEKERAEFLERANLYHEYLPYAIVFRVAWTWADRFAAIQSRARQGTDQGTPSMPIPEPSTQGRGR